MSTLFFLLSLLFAWQAWNLYHPNFDNPKWSFMSFAFGLPTGELAPHVIFWQALTVAFFVLTGSVWGLFGALGLRSWLSSPVVISLSLSPASGHSNSARQTMRLTVVSVP